VQSIVAGTNVTVDNTDPANPIVSATGGGGGGASVTVADVPPDLAYSTPGNLWWDSSVGIMMIHYDDGTSEQWVAASPALLAAQPIRIRGAAWSSQSALIAANANQVHVYFPNAATIRSCTIIANATGYCEIDVRKTTLAALPAVVGDSICGGFEPGLSADLYSQDNVLYGWDTSVAAGEVLTFVLLSSSTIKSVSIQLGVEEIT
jgi:hypothetical protein